MIDSYHSSVLAASGKRENQNHHAAFSMDVSILLETIGATGHEHDCSSDELNVMADTNELN